MTRLDPFLEVACGYTWLLWLGLTTTLFLFVLDLLSLAFAEPGTASFAIALVTLAMLLVLGSAVSGLFWACRRRAGEV